MIEISKVYLTKKSFNFFDLEKMKTLRVIENSKVDLTKRSFNFFDLEKMKTLKVIEMEKKQLEEERQKLEEEKVRSDILKIFWIFVLKSVDPYLEISFRLFGKGKINIWQLSQQYYWEQMSLGTWGCSVM